MKQEIKSLIKKEIKHIDEFIEKNNLSLEISIQLYNSIYYNYGSKLYKKYVPKYIQKADINTLLFEQRYIDIYTKYGEKTFSKYESTAYSNDVIYESNNIFKAFVYDFRTEFLYFFKTRIVPFFAALAMVVPFSTALASEKQKENNYKKHTDEITMYLNNVDNYGKQIANYKLSDLENIMKIMYDTWNNIQGYGMPEKDLIGYLGLDIQNGVGVCRNFADDMSRRLNAINPNYKAHSITVNVSNSENIDFPIANIEKKDILFETLKMNNFNTSSLPYTYPLKNLLPNHAIVFLTIPNKNIPLIVDPVNLSLGTFSDGKITFFNIGKNNNEHSFSRSIIGDLLISGFSGFEYSLEYFSSFNNSDYSFDELNNLYGIDAQNKALQKVRYLPVLWSGYDDYKNLYNNNLYNNNRSKKTSFKDSLIVTDNYKYNSKIAKKINYNNNKSYNTNYNNSRKCDLEK